MNNPFQNISEANLKSLLVNYRQWLSDNPEEQEHITNRSLIENVINSKILNTNFLRELDDDEYYQTVRDYVNGIDGVFLNFTKEKIKEDREELLEVIEYVNAYDGDPFILAEELIEGDKKLHLYARSFWTPILEAKYSNQLTNWNYKTEQCLKKLGLNLNNSMTLPEKYKAICDTFKYIQLLDSDLTFDEIDHFMHFCTAVNEGIAQVDEMLEISNVLNEFLKQANSDDLKTSKYPKEIKGLNTKFSFGQGSKSKVPWIWLDINKRDESNGLFICYLYYLEQSKIVLAFGVREESNIQSIWPDEVAENYSKVSETMPDAFRYGDSFVFKVYDVIDGEIDSPKEDIESDLNEILGKYRRIAKSVDKRYWIITAERDTGVWKTFVDEGQISVAKNNYGLTDINNYETKDDVEAQIVDFLTKEGNPPENSKKNTTLMFWQFANEIEIGDVVIAKDGSNTLLGYGEIQSDYVYDPDLENHNHIRSVEWKTINEVNSTGGIDRLVSKRLTDLTPYGDYANKLISAIDGEYKSDDGSDDALTLSDSLNFWWMNCNPKVWDLPSKPVGTKEIYTAYNDNDNKRRVFSYFEEAKVGDLIIGYTATPLKEVTSICRISKEMGELDGKGIEFEVVQQFPNTISYKELKDYDELKNSEPMKNNQGSLFKLSKTEYDFVTDLLNDLNPDLTKKEEEFTKEMALKDLFIDDTTFDSIINALSHKKNIILQGPPGVGKTYYAKRIAYTLIGRKTKSQVETVQFHQSYSYEDFIQGYRPTDEGNFELKNGTFYQFSKRAQRDPENKYVLIIDEINRGNLSKIFGELMMLIESDKRGEDNEITLAYQDDIDLKFFIPENLYIIGTMNTADRSLAMVDYALRRRFRFIDLEPEFNDKFISYLLNMNVTEVVANRIIDVMVSLNLEIADSKESQLGKGFCIGHSFFTPISEVEDSEQWYLNVVNNEISPLLEEYFYDNHSKFEEIVNSLK